MNRVTDYLIVIFCIVYGVSAKIHNYDGVKLKEVQNISQFVTENPGSNLIRMNAYTHDDASRTYSLGRRQTG